MLGDDDDGESRYFCCHCLARRGDNCCDSGRGTLKKEKETLNTLRVGEKVVVVAVKSLQRLTTTTRTMFEHWREESELEKERRWRNKTNRQRRRRQQKMPTDGVRRN